MRIDLPSPRFNEGLKVREIFDVSEIVPDALLMVTTDRISAFDVGLKNGIPWKGVVLNTISAFFFEETRHVCPNHMITTDFNELPPELKTRLGGYEDILQGRFMLVQKLEPLKVECIVRRDVDGSGWKSYEKTGEICGIVLPKGLEKGGSLPDPIFTPSTKAGKGEHDRNINFEEMVEILGDEDLAFSLRKISLELFAFAEELLKSKGIRLRDTKFEFAVIIDPVTEELVIVLIDEALTPDSSRYMPDLSKQIVRDWLTENGLDGKENVELPQDVVNKTKGAYIEICRIITRQKE
jgi:phosphoribosylaminoimidazole-succinocarboxamide synthase